MDPLSQTLELYRDLAERYEKLNQLSMRDRFLMLAAGAALEAGRVDEAERLRQRLLHANRHHMLHPFKSFAEAYDTPDVQNYLRDLRENYSPQTAQLLLESLLNGPPLESQMPSSWGKGNHAPVIPPTAPVLDPQPRQQQQQQSQGSPQDAPRPIWQAAPAPQPQKIPAQPRPKAQPVPIKRDAQPAKAASPQPTVPAAQKKPPATKPTPTVKPIEQPATEQPQPGPTGGGGSFGVVLGTLVFFVGLLLLVVTLLRPLGSIHDLLP
jgi:hypothetical protein